MQWEHYEERGNTWMWYLAHYIPERKIGDIGCPEKSTCRNRGRGGSIEAIDHDMEFAGCQGLWKGFVRNNGTSTSPLEIYTRSHFENETTGKKGRPETPEDINWTNVSSHFGLEIASSIKVRKW
ncbi:hypothetical protein Q9L58_002357 [Maublancomyces gigas]|uniref:Uncharacterized protein n=1 Tax=Discina gigas TaxID=1032678 RepID=A0ABR3GRT3_9PEZI